jgi:hypothetical protein
LTAEAVAEHLKRPLYIVGASELSTTPSILEEKLKSILSVTLTDLDPKFVLTSVLNSLPRHGTQFS